MNERPGFVSSGNTDALPDHLANVFSSQLGRNAKKRLGRITLHLSLIAGAMIFALPFLWLVTTSFKEDEEVFSDPPRWIPLIPTNSTASPFVDVTHVSDFLPSRDQPALMTKWSERIQKHRILMRGLEQKQEHIL